MTKNYWEFPKINTADNNNKQLRRDGEQGNYWLARRALAPVWFFVAMMVIGLSCRASETSVLSIEADPPPPKKAELLVTYPYPQGDQAYDNRIRYFIELLDMTLRASGRRYHLTPYQVPMTTAGRSRQNIQQGYYDVAWIHTSLELERTLLPIRVPLLKGLIGWRLFFIRSGDVQKFGRVTTLDELRAYIAGQGYDYPDNVILEASEFPLRTGLHRNNVLQMLLKKRVDYFPRSITEIYDEWQVFAEAGLAIEQTLALRYPSAFYFFVDKRNIELAEALSDGLKMMLGNGEFDALFDEYFGEIIERSRLEQRTVFNIPHPVLSNSIPLQQQEYWFRPLAGK